MSFLQKLSRLLGTDKLTKEETGQMFGYTSASITLGGAGYPIAVFHQQFLSYVEGLDTRRAGAVSLVGGLWDAFNDPMMGVITDRTRSKYGRHRLYLLIAVIPFAISYIMRWCSFGWFTNGSSALMGYYMAGILLYTTAFTIADVPHVAMLPQLAPQYFLRTQYKSVEYIMNSVGQVSSYVFTALALANFNIKTALVDLPNPSPADKSKYMMVGLILSVWFAWPLILSFFTAKEPSSLAMHNEPFDLRYFVNEYVQVFKNKSFRQYFIISLFFMISRGLYSITDQYFMISVADKYKYFNSLNIVAGCAEAAGLPINYFLIKKFGKPVCGKILGPLMVLGLGINIFITPHTASWLSSVILTISAICYNLGFSGPDFVIENIQPDVTDTDEMITGRKREGVVATFSSLFRKTVSSLMSYIVGASIKRFGYDVNVTSPAAQSAMSLFGLRLNFVILPTIFALITVMTVYRFSMTGKDHDCIRRVIAEKHDTGEAAVTDAEKQRLEKITGIPWEKMWIGCRPDNGE